MRLLFARGSDNVAIEPRCAEPRRKDRDECGRLCVPAALPTACPRDRTSNRQVQRGRDVVWHRSVARTATQTEAPRVTLWKIRVERGRFESSDASSFFSRL